MSLVKTTKCQARGEMEIGRFISCTKNSIGVYR